jgi:catechol 2,3-dioxygenase-like lactoylglutathione lyase family enzyme
MTDTGQLHPTTTAAAVSAGDRTAIRPRVIFGNHSAFRVPLAERDTIREFYRDVLGGEITREEDRTDYVRLGGDFHIAFLYTDDGDGLDDDGFLKATWLELKAVNVEEMRQAIVAFGVTVIEVRDPHLYFQAPGGQVLRLVAVSEDLSRYEGTGRDERSAGQAVTAAAAS